MHPDRGPHAVRLEETVITWILNTAGALLILLALRDIFHTLWHPSSSGTVSRLIARAFWRVSHAGSRDPGSTVGSVILVSVVLAWALLIVAGFTLVYWPHMEEQFFFSSGLNPPARSDLADSVYLSLVTFATLGYGDIVPVQSWLRFVAPLEALVGFVLLSASITWVLQLYPALGRRRSLALQLKSLEQQQLAVALPQLDSSAGADLLSGLSQSLGQSRMDMTQFGHGYYFSDAVETSLPAHIGYVRELCEAGARSGRQDVRLMAGALASSLDDFATLLREDFIPAAGDTDHVLQAYRADHHRRSG